MGREVRMVPPQLAMRLLKELLAKGWWVDSLGVHHDDHGTLMHDIYGDAVWGQAYCRAFGLEER